MSLRTQVLSAVACAIAVAPVTAGELQILARAQHSTREARIGPVQLAEPGTAVIRSAEELVARSGQASAAKDAKVQRAITGEVAELLGVEGIDWNKQMVLVVRGEPGTKADTVTFDALTVEGKTLTVEWRVKPRPPHAGPGTPVALLLVERFDGEVKFVTPAQK